MSEVAHHPNIDPGLVYAMRLGDEALWRTGDASATVTTMSGATYTLESDGRIRGGSFQVDGRLQGSVYSSPVVGVVSR